MRKQSESNCWILIKITIVMKISELLKRTATELFFKNPKNVGLSYSV